MKLYYYKALKIIEPTALVELLQKFHFNEKEIINVFEKQNRIYLAISKNEIMEEIESLYPGVFKLTENLVVNGNVIFSLIK